MILEGYTEALVVLPTSAQSTGNINTRATYLVIRGTDGVVDSTVTLKAVRIPAATTRIIAVGYLDGATVGTDPKRMKQVMSVEIMNNDSINHVIKVGVEDASTERYSVFLAVPAGGSATWEKSVGWNRYNAQGRRLGGGSYNPGGF